jgi:hypothetical protein
MTLVTLGLRNKRWTGHVARMGKKNKHRVLVRKLEEKRLLGRPRRRWKDKIKRDLEEILEGVEFAQDMN